MGKSFGFDWEKEGEVSSCKPKTEIRSDKCTLSVSVSKFEDKTVSE
jgi:hypothetical protein